MQAPAEITLYRFADTAWRGVVRPWLLARKDLSLRSWFVVATRGQAHAWKQRCIDERIPLLGVEFLTPGLARQKWVAGGELARPVLGRELLLFILRSTIERRLQEVVDETDRALLTSLRSDAETAMDDYDRLLRSGRDASGFPWEPLRAVFAEVEEEVRSLGFDLAPWQAKRASEESVGTALPARLLVMGLGVESWGEFHNVFALARRCRSAHVVLPEPEFRGKRELDERWIELWETALGAAALPPDVPDPDTHCGGAVEGWLPKSDRADPFAPDRVSFSVGMTRRDEAELACEQVDLWLRGGATQVAMIFARGGATHAHVVRGLRTRGIAFADHVGRAITVPRETRMQRGLIRLWSREGRWEDLLALWPHLLALGLTTVSKAALRRAVEQWYDDTQGIRIMDTFAAARDYETVEWKAVQTLVPRLGLAWPDRLTLGDAWGRVEQVFQDLEVGLPPTWPALAKFASAYPRELSRSEVLQLLDSFLADTPAESAAPENGFARVTLSTRRRAEMVPWSHLILMESNAGVWPERRESSCWLPDDARRALVEGNTTGFPLFTADDTAWLEKMGFGSLARDTAEKIVLSAARYDEREPEELLSPNGWLERVLWHSRAKEDRKTSLEELFVRATHPQRTHPLVNADDLGNWHAHWASRRDPAQPFDAYFFCVDPAQVRPEVLPARVIENGVKDPAELWFSAVLGARPVDWSPLIRERRKWIGQRVHQALAEALRAPAIEGEFGRCRPWEEVRGRVLNVIAGWRGGSPVDVYWDSCYKELEGLALQLVDRLSELPLPPYVAVEYKLPREAWVPLTEGERLRLAGRIDVIFSDRPSLPGAEVAVVDFKTGLDKDLTAKAMARGRSLQLGLYLAAARSLGATRGTVRMVRPDSAGGEGLAMTELDDALVGLRQIAEHLRTGKYGALTPDYSDYGPEPLTLPLASVPVPAPILHQKFELTFGVGFAVEDDDA